MFPPNHLTLSPTLSPTISLPSIREMFPDYLLKNTSHPATASQIPRSSALSSQYPRQRDEYATRQNSSRPHIYDLPPITSQDRHSPSSSRHSAYSGQTQQPTSKNLSDSRYSFDVLKSDPTRPSLEHLTSCATFPNRSTTKPGQNGQVGVNNGSMSSFRVSVASPQQLSFPNPNDRQRRSTVSVMPTQRQGATVISRSNAASISSPSGVMSFPHTTSTRLAASHSDVLPNTDASNVSEDDSPSESSNGKKHICPTCGKRFNRPSSLRIHANTHTGATPFRCPWQNCGREFNVNSNMRRHYRNHTTPGFSRAPSNDSRRRRRRTAPSPRLAFIEQSGSNHARHSHGNIYSQSQVNSGFPMNGDSEDDASDSFDHGPYSARDMDEEDELLEYDTPYDPLAAHHAVALSQSMARVSVGIPAAPCVRTQFGKQQQLRSDLRSATPGSSFPSSSPSPSLSPSPSPRQTHMYSPSTQYFRSGTNSHVSTALRPAFSGRRTSVSIVKDEHMSDIW